MDDAKRVCVDLGLRIIELRRERGMTQEGLAALIQLDARDVRRIEAGGNTTVRTLAQIARGLKVTVAELFVQPTTRGHRRPGRPKGPS